MTGTRYYSSPDKNVVRTEFDLPLIEAMYQRKGDLLRYFGLPGAEALDLRTWGHRLQYVAAVEFDRQRLVALEQRLDTYHSSIRYRTHHGDADKVILGNGSNRLEPDGRRSWRYVATMYRPDVGYVWDFDVVYLDYFGKFLPYDRGSRVVQNRALALRHLFAVHRQDAWQPWILMLTVESRLFGPPDRQQMRDYLLSAKAGAGPEVGRVLEHLLEGNLPRAVEAARLVQGTMAYVVSIAAANADVVVRPRGTIMYRGATDMPMLHLAYEIVPAGPLSVHQDVLPLLKAPILRVLDPTESPWFELVQDQPADQTQADVRSALDFLPPALLDAIVGTANQGTVVTTSEGLTSDG